MRCLLIEDEPLAMLRLKEYVQRVPFLTLVHAVDNGLAALPLLKQASIDLVFLDIEMDGLSGIQLLEALPVRPAVILTTAYDQYALKAFDLQVADYLVKPFTFERFMQAVGRVQQPGSTLISPVPSSFLFVKTEYRLQRVALDQILYIEGMRDYRRIHLATEKIMTLETFGELEQQLPAQQFCRVHKSYLVAVAKVESVERDRLTIQQTLIPLSTTYRARFYQLIHRSAK